MDKHPVVLKRKLGFLSAFGVAVGLTVSGTAMFTVGTVAALTENAAFITTALAMIPMLAAALAFGELSSMLPSSGMISEYTAPALGKFWGAFAILSGYVVLIVCDGGTQYAVAGIAIERITGIPALLIAFLMLILITAINYTGVGLYGITETVASLVLLVLYFGFGFFGLLNGGIQSASSGEFLPEGGWHSVFSNVGVAVWFFIGIEFVCPMAEENKKPYRNIPIAMLLSLICAYATDVLFAASAVRLVPKEVLLSTSTPLVDVGTALGGKTGGILIAVFIVLASFTTGNAYLAALPRMLYGMAKEGQVPALFAKVHPKYRVPSYGILITSGVMGIVLLIIMLSGAAYGVIYHLIQVACINWLILYCIAMLDVVVLRKKYPDFPRLWKSPMPKVIFVIGTAGSIFAIITMKEMLPVSILIWGITALYIILWNKKHGLGLNDVVPLEISVRNISERTEALPAWDDAVSDWLRGRGGLYQEETFNSFHTALDHINQE